MAVDRARHDAVVTRAMGVFFATGSLCFVAGPLTAYANLVGGYADALTFFIGSILFTLGGASQCLLAAPERPERPTGLAGAIFYLSSPRRGLLPRCDHEGWWEASVNLLGCVLFGISAVTGYATGQAGTLISPAISNWTTTLGAACFLACALTACGLGFTLKAPRLRQLRNLTREVVEAVEDEVREVRDFVEIMTETVAEEIRATEYQE